MAFKIMVNSVLDFVDSYTKIGNSLIIYWSFIN